MKFYYAPGTCALASHIALEEAGANFEAVRLDFAASQQTSPGYLAINPKGRVPAIETDRGIITETPAILAWIAQSYPAAGLAPVSDPFAFAQVQAFNTYLCSTVHVAHAHRPRAYRWADDPAAQEAMRKKVPQTMSECFQLIENDMPEAPWVQGETYTICDPYLFTISRWLKSDGVDIANFPRVAAHAKRVAERPAVQKALALY